MKTGDHIWRSSPRRTAPKILEKTFVGDGKLVDRLVAQVEQSVATRNKHYNVIVGDPGIGKSHTLAVVVGRVRKSIPDEDAAVAWLPDDPSGLASELHLFEAILGAVGEDARAGERDAAATRSRLLDVLGRRTLLLCIEELDRVLAALGDEGQRGLRAFLQEGRKCAVLATATELTADFTDQSRTFFGFFGVERIDEMDAKATIRLLAAHARARGDAELAAAVKSAEHRPVVLALHHVLGGLPGTYVDLVRSTSELAAPESILLRALDEHARWTRAPLERCSTQQRLILHWLSGRRGAAQVKHIARACAISEQTVSPQLRVLRRAGWVAATRVGRETWYEMRDPLHGIDCAYARELFRFLCAWFEDRDAALVASSPIASRVRDGIEHDDGGDPRRALALPALERGLVAASRASKAR